MCAAPTPLTGRKGFVATASEAWSIVAGTELSNRSAKANNGVAFSDGGVDSVSLEITGRLLSQTSTAFVAKNSTDTWLYVNSTGRIRAEETGVKAKKATSFDMTLEGQIIAGKTGIELDRTNAADLDILGAIEAKVGITDTGDLTHITVGPLGLIDVKEYAYRGGDGAVTILNQGIMGGHVELGGGNDVFINDVTGEVQGWIYTGGGNDSVTGLADDEKVLMGNGDNTADLGDGDNKVIIDGRGQNTVITGTGTDQVEVVKAAGVGGNLGIGRDTLIVTSDGTGFSVDMDVGRDTATLGKGQGSGNIYMGDGADEVSSNMGGVMIYLEDGDDVARLGKKADHVDGGEGNDDIVAKGDGSYFGGDGNDTIIFKGGAAQGQIDGGTGHDTLKGGDHDDHIDGSDGNDVITGGKGRDVLIGGAGNDEISGGKGADGLSFGDGDDTATGGAGEDRFFFGQSNTGTKTVTDFDIGEDTLVFDGWSLSFTAADMATAATKVGRDMVVDMSLIDAGLGFSIVLEGMWGKLADEDLFFGT